MHIHAKSTAIELRGADLDEGISPTRSTISPTSPAGSSRPVSPSRISSGAAPRRKATTGVPLAMASGVVVPMMCGVEHDYIINSLDKLGAIPGFKGNSSSSDKSRFIREGGQNHRRNASAQDRRAIEDHIIQQLKDMKRMAE